MKATLPILLSATIALTGCERISNSSFNPLNWFGSVEPAAPVDATTGELLPLTPANADSVIDARTLAGTIVSMSVERTPDGAIVRATGTTTAPSQFNAQLVPIDASGGRLTLAMRFETPQSVTSAAVEPRQITAAYVVDNAVLAGIRTIQVQGANNALSRRR